MPFLNITPTTSGYGIMSDESDLSQVFETDDIFTRKDAISGLKSSPWEGLNKLVNIPWTVQILEYDITTFNIAFPIPYTLQKSKD